MKMKLVSFGALFLALALLFSFLFSKADALLAPAVQADATPSTLVILDAGHGGEDGGATGVNGVLEKELNLYLTTALAQLLRMAGYSVIETRTDDRLLYPEGTQKGHKKSQDLKGRLAVAEKHPDSVFISIHMNTYPTPNCEGTQIWYSENHPASREWASALQQRTQALLQPGNHRKIKSATSGIYLLRHATTPAVLIECGFLSTPTECEKLCDHAYLRALALTFFSVIDEKIT